MSVQPPTAVLFVVSGTRPPEEGDPAKVAARLRLPPPGDRWSAPQRFWLLCYLAALIDVADFERTVFNAPEARAALEALIEEARELIAMLSHRGKPRSHTP